MLNAFLLIMGIIFVALLVLPIVVYMCVKFGVYAFYKAKELANRGH